MPRIIKVADPTEATAIFPRWLHLIQHERESAFCILRTECTGKSMTITVIRTLLGHDKGDIAVDGHRIGEENGKIRKKRA